MLKRSAIKKYGNKLLPKLRKRYGERTFYNASQIRSTVYQCNFNPSYLLVGYLFFLEKKSLSQIMTIEFPQVCIGNYEEELRVYLNKRKYYDCLHLLAA